MFRVDVVGGVDGVGVVVASVIERDVRRGKALIASVLTHFDDGARVDASLPRMYGAPENARALVPVRTNQPIAED